MPARRLFGICELLPRREFAFLPGWRKEGELAFRWEGRASGPALEGAGHEAHGHQGQARDHQHIDQRERGAVEVGQEGGHRRIPILCSAARNRLPPSPKRPLPTASLR